MARPWLPPRPPRSSPWWALVSVVVHVVVVALVLVSTRRTFPVPPVMVVLAPGGALGDTAAIPWSDVAGRRAGGPAGGSAADIVRTAVASLPAVVPDTVRPAGPPARPGAEERGAGPARVEEPVGRPGARMLGARLGDGRLWVSPWDAIAAAIAGAGDTTADAATHVARIDSAIAQRILAYLDTLAPDSLAIKPPEWVTEIGGQKWGIDGTWIHLGGLKLPAAILGLLPLPQGNFEQAQHAAELQRIREDILQAARRAENAADFRKYVEETRRRRDAEREAKRNQTIKPDSIKT